MASEYVLFQLSSFFALIGMTLGWRGVMTRYAGFYDLPTAWNQVFWGIVLGGFYAVSSDGSLFLPYLERTTQGADATTGLNLFSLIFLPLVASIGAHFLLRRKRVRTGGSQPTSGWALGLAIGGMLSMVTLFRMFEFEDIYSVMGLLQVVLVATFTPRVEALITARQGALMLSGYRWGAVLRATLWRATFLVALYYAVLNPIAWVFILAIVVLVTPSVEQWIWDSLPREGQRRLRRMWAEQARGLYGVPKRIHDLEIEEQ